MDIVNGDVEMERKMLAVDGGWLYERSRTSPRHITAAARDRMKPATQPAGPPRNIHWNGKNPTVLFI